MNTLSTITVLPENKQEIKKYCQQAKQELLSGDYKPLKILKQLKSFQQIIDNLLKDNDVEDLMWEEANKYGSKTFEDEGATFQVKETGNYDFYACNDSEWEELKKQEEHIKKLRKKREETLKAHDEPWTNPETGEMIYPPVKQGKSKVAVYLK